jgi:hypothetical protein
MEAVRDYARRPCSVNEGPQPRGYGPRGCVHRRRGLVRVPWPQPAAYENSRSRFIPIVRVRYSIWRMLEGLPPNPYSDAQFRSDHPRAKACASI